MDPVADVMRALRLKGGVFVEARFTAPWSVSVRIEPEDCAPFMARPAVVIGYHVVLSGALLSHVAGAPPVAAGPGAVLLFPHGDAHVLTSDLALPPVRSGPLLSAPGPDGMRRIDHGGGGAETRVVCGFLASDDGEEPLLASLPPMLAADMARATAREWVEASARFAAAELAAGRFADSGLMARLSEALLIEAVRAHAAGVEGPGWLRGVGDPQIGRALAAIHREPGAPWSVEALAREAAMSRSAFVARFGALVGEPPIRYLAARRLQAARARLRDGGATVARVAEQFGYESEAAFSRAFRRRFGAPPGRLREAAAR